ncbi:hypothetical protein BDZ94DRAFT_1228692 [Collybia nuda]|uniref:Heterokaryon incompatibility domain-containing protein n=1 Tax=Collybia nuda TaxID=64659 RepID=A0A9P5XUU1_9AGAR|nr:hypothetical protein BDZ94DRAFT_1228692 [Collybia nuda]
MPDRDQSSMLEDNNLSPDIRKLVCARCWGTVFSSKSFRILWEESPEGIRLSKQHSFCIIQDSDEDKAQEIAKMRLNFRNAFITILSSRANSVSEGFLHNTHSSPPLTPIRLPFRCPDGNVGTFIIFRHSEIVEPTDSRAWCLGERVLSPRLLVFSTYGLQYECQTTRINVNGSPLGIPSSLPRLPDYALTAEPGRVAEWQLDMAWDVILQRYTASGLSQQEDKLLAIAGIAEQFHRLWPRSRYAAGIWTHQLPSALLWQQQGYDLRERPKIYRAPSWSWASVDGLVAPRGMAGNADTWRSASESLYDSVNICEVKKVEAEVKFSSNPYGAVTSASLILCAETVRITWNTPENPHVILPDKLSERGYLMAGHRVLDSVGYVQMDALDLPDLPIVEVTLAGVTKHPVPLPSIARLGQHDIYGIMLLRVHEEGSDVTNYRRIGSFSMNAENWFPTSRHDIHII